MSTTLEDSTAAIRSAVSARMAATPADDPKMVGYVSESRTVVSSHWDNADMARADAMRKLQDAAGPSETYAEWVQPTDNGRLLGDGITAVAGTTAKFGTGAVRSDTFEEFRYDLVSPIGLREVARACAEGAAKYGDWNWERGMPVHDLLNHAIAHIYGFLSGDRSEPHLGHAAWNLLAAIHSSELWPALNAGTLRREGCQAPVESADGYA